MATGQPRATGGDAHPVPIDAPTSQATAGHGPRLSRRSFVRAACGSVLWLSAMSNLTACGGDDDDSTQPAGSPSSVLPASPVRVTPSPTPVPPTPSPTNTPAATIAASPVAARPIAPAAPVVHFRADAGRSGVIDAAVPETAPRVLWQRRVGRVAHGAPVLADDMLYVPTVEGRLDALDAATGEVRWSFRLPIAYGFVSSPAIVDGILFAGSEQDALHAVDIGSGDQLWSLDAGSPVYTAPLIVNGILFFANEDGVLYAVDPVTRDAVWRVDTKLRPLWPAAYGSGTIVLAADMSLFAVDARAGAIVWQVAAGGYWYSPAVAGETVYAGTSDGRFVALDLASGAERWVFASGSRDWSGPTLTDELVIAGNVDRRVYALDRMSGEQRWSIEIEDWAFTDLVRAGATVFASAGNHENREGPRSLYALDAARGAERWRFTADGRLLAPPAIGDGMIYVASHPGTCYALGT